MIRVNFGSIPHFCSNNINTNPRISQYARSELTRMLSMPLTNSLSFKIPVNRREVVSSKVVEHNSKEYQPALKEPFLHNVSRGWGAQRRGAFSVPTALKPPSLEGPIRNSIVGRKRHHSPYLLKELDGCYAGENEHDCAFGRLYEKDTGCKWHVKYLNNQEREKYLVTVNARGEILDSSGKALFTTCGANFGGAAMFIMDAQGNFFVSTHEEDGVFQHSSLVGGEPVAMAGEIKVERGRVEYISNSSGHYKPSREHMEQCLRRMRELGISLRGVEVELCREAKFILRG